MNTQKPASYIYRFRYLLIGAPIVMALIGGLLLFNIHINSDLNTYFPESMQSKINQSAIEEIFGKEEILILAIETDDVLESNTLARLRQINDSLLLNAAFKEVMSLFETKSIKGEDGMMLVDPAIAQMPSTPEETEELRTIITQNELAYGLLLSKDYKHTLFILTIAQGADDNTAVEAAQKIIAQNIHPDDKIFLFGLPFLRVEANEKISRDFIILLPIGILLMIAFLFISFREKRGVWLPMLVVVLSTLVSLALLPVMGWDLSLIGIIIPVMMIAIANNYGVHIVARYQEVIARNPDWSNSQVIMEVYHKLKTPVILTGLTTIVGILGLVTHIMIPAQQMGIITALGVGFALWMSLGFIPAILMLMKKGKVRSDLTFENHASANPILSIPARFASTKPWIVVFIFVSFLILAASGMSFFRIAPDNNDVMPHEHPYNQALRIANTHFGGTRQISLVFTGDMKDPEILQRMDYYETEIEKLPQTGSVTSIATLLRIMSKALNDPDEPLYNRIPDTREGVAQYLELYSMSGDPEDLEKFVDFPFENAIMNIQFQAKTMKELKQLIGFITQLTANDPALHTMGGYCLQEKEMSDNIVKGQIYSLAFAIVAIFILLMLIFKSLKAGWIGSLPLAFAIISMFGIMGWVGLELNIVTALLSSISIGVGVDYTIHLFWRIKTELTKTSSWEQAIMTSLTTTGRGIAINAFSVMLGFSVLSFSQFPYLRTFGFLIILSLALCLLCALILIPAVCAILKPAFLLPGKAPQSPNK